MKKSCFIILGILDFVFHCYKGNTKPTDVSISVMFSNISSIKSMMLLILRYCFFLITIPNIGLMKYIYKKKHCGIDCYIMLLLEMELHCVACYLLYTT